MKGRKVVFFLIDGLGDTSIPALQDRTPLQATATPSFDLLACTCELDFVLVGHHLQRME